jgi:hypothetical protein
MAYGQLHMAFGHLSTGLLRNPEHLAALRADKDKLSAGHTAAAPPTISDNSVVIAAWRALL